MEHTRQAPPSKGSISADTKPRSVPGAPLPGQFTAHAPPETRQLAGGEARIPFTFAGIRALLGTIGGTRRERFPPI